MSSQYGQVISYIGFADITSNSYSGFQAGKLRVLRHMFAKTEHNLSRWSILGLFQREIWQNWLGKERLWMVKFRIPVLRLNFVEKFDIITKI